MGAGRIGIIHSGVGGTGQNSLRNGQYWSEVSAGVRGISQMFCGS